MNKCCALPRSTVTQRMEQKIKFFTEVQGFVCLARMISALIRDPRP